MRVAVHRTQTSTDDPEPSSLRMRELLDLDPGAPAYDKLNALRKLFPQGSKIFLSVGNSWDEVGVDNIDQLQQSAALLVHEPAREAVQRKEDQDHRLEKLEEIVQKQGELLQKQAPLAEISKAALLDAWRPLSSSKTLRTDHMNSELKRQVTKRYKGLKDGTRRCWVLNSYLPQEQVRCCHIMPFYWGDTAKHSAHLLEHFKLLKLIHTWKNMAELHVSIEWAMDHGYLILLPSADGQIKVVLLYQDIANRRLMDVRNTKGEPLINYKLCEAELPQAHGSFPAFSEITFKHLDNQVLHFPDDVTDRPSKRVLNTFAAVMIAHAEHKEWVERGAVRVNSDAWSDGSADAQEAQRKVDAWLQNIHHAMAPEELQLAQSETVLETTDSDAYGDESPSSSQTVSCDNPYELLNNHSTD